MRLYLTVLKRDLDEVGDQLEAIINNISSRTVIPDLPLKDLNQPAIIRTEHSLCAPIQKGELHAEIESSLLLKLIQGAMKSSAMSLFEILKQNY